MNSGFNLNTRSLWEHPKGPQLNPEVKQRISQAAESFRRTLATGSVGFYHWPSQIEEAELAAIEAVASNLRERYQGALIFGIGGSHLGAAAALNCLRSLDEEAAFPIQWVSNTDAKSLAAAERFASQRKTAAVLISKSGSTVETLSGFAHLSRLFDDQAIVAITDPTKGTLREWAGRYHWPSFTVPPNVGGRFSVLTAVGLLPMALGGIDIRLMIEGAKNTHRLFDTQAAVDNPAYLLAAALWLWDTQFRVDLHYLMPYQASAKLLADWFVQLWGESLGKQGHGPTPVAALGTTDQHSLLQLFYDGPRNKVIGFLNAESETHARVVGACRFNLGEHQYLSKHSFQTISRNALIATQTALEKVGVPSYRIEMPRLDAETLGQFYFFFETACGFAGELYGINAYDQPGVEEAKRLLRGSL